MHATLLVLCLRAVGGDELRLGLVRPRELDLLGGREDRDHVRLLHQVRDRVRLRHAHVRGRNATA